MHTEVHKLLTTSSSKLPAKCMLNHAIIHGYIRQVTKTKQFGHGRALHLELMDSGLDSDTHIGNLLIQMYRCLGDVHLALSAFRRISHPNEFSWNITIAAYADNGYPPAATSLALLMPHWSVVTLNSCITAYAQLGSLRRAKHLFDQSPERSAVSWGAMVSAYASEGKFFEARQVFVRSPSLTLITYNTMITALGHEGDVEYAKALFDSMPETNVVSWTCLLSAYARNGHLHSARMFFEKMTDKPVIAWNIMISAFALSNQGRTALELFRAMDLEGVEASSVSLVSALDACSSLGLQDCRTVHSIIRDTTEFTTNTEVGNVCMNMFAKLGSVSDAKSLFDEMPKRDVISWTTLTSAYASKPDELAAAQRVFEKMPNRNVVSWNSMLNGYAQNGHLEAAMDIFHRIPNPDVVSWNVVLTLHAQNGRVSEAETVFDSIPQPNLYCWNAMLAAYAQNGYNDRALWLYRRMEMEGVKASQVTLVSALDACAGTYDLTMGKLLHKRAVAECFELEGPLGSSLLNMYGSCGRIETSMRIFDGLRNPNDVSWTAIISAYAHDGQTEVAMDLFRRMVAEGFQPSRITFVSVLSVCGQSGEFSIGLELFRAMKQDYGVEPGANHYACMVDLVSRLGELENAENVLRGMPLSGHHKDDTVSNALAWKTLLGASRNCGDTNTGRRACHEVLAIQDSLADDSTPYVLLSNTFATAESEAPLEKSWKLCSSIMPLA